MVWFTFNQSKKLKLHHCPNTKAPECTFLLLHFTETKNKSAQMDIFFPPWKHKIWYFKNIYSEMRKFLVVLIVIPSLKVDFQTWWQSWPMSPMVFISRTSCADEDHVKCDGSRICSEHTLKWLCVGIKTYCSDLRGDAAGTFFFF